MPERILAMSKNLSTLVTSKVAEILQVTRSTKMLALNAAVEAARAGEAGRGFSIVAEEVGRVSASIGKITNELTDSLESEVSQLDNLGRQMVANVRGTRLSDLALNMIDIIDRNLYERSCDVRWWATDAAMVDCAAEPTPETCRYASRRLGVILDSYTVYLDLWILDMHGEVLANGRPERFKVKGGNHAGEKWFQDAMKTSDGGQFAVADVMPSPELGQLPVATYSTAIRENGEANGRVLGVLGILFDWQPQSQAVVDGVRLDEREADRTRCLLLDSSRRIIAASDKNGVLKEKMPLKNNGQAKGAYMDEQGNMVGFALTPGYETYQGLGWYGVVIQTPQKVV